MISNNPANMLLSETIMDELERAAVDSKRGQKRLETLSRLKIACDDIASGKAADYADKAGADSTLFKILPRRINSVSVGEYIKIRRQTARGHDGAKLWPGPNPSTLRADETLKKYLDARQIEANGFQKRRHTTRLKVPSVDEIVSKIPDQGDRHLIMIEIEKGRAAGRKLRLAVEAVPKLWAVDLDAVINGSATTARGSASELTDDDRLAVRHLLMKLTSNAELRRFNLIYDNSRVKMSGGTGEALISKNELALLRSLAKVGA